MTTTDAAPPADGPPRWDLTPLFPAVDHPEVAAAEAALGQAVTALAELYDRHGVRGAPPGALAGATRPAVGAGPPPAVAAAVLDEVLPATNDVLERDARLEAFAYGHVSTDSGDEAAQALLSRLSALEARIAVLGTRLDAWLGTLDLDAVVAASPQAAAHAWPLRRAARRAAHLMSEPEEAIAAEMAVTGSTAWERLYDDVTAGVTATVEHPGGPSEELPIFAVRGLAAHPDPAVRQAAFRAELAAWQASATPIAAALNAIKGETLALDRHRGWDDPLAPVLEASAVERPAFDAMQAAVDASLDDFRRYLAAKARLLGKDRCAFWDLFAPVGDAPPRPWTDATAMVEEAFAGYGDDLAALARRALAERWVDAGPRAGKVGGGFCMPVGDGASRILMNYDGSVDSVHTLAHELGHAYHNQVLAERTPLQRATPMALAETASIFCETILTDRALDATTGGQRLALLEADLQGACQVVVDIRSRFLFESRLFERRRTATVPARELSEVMAAAQAEAYGDGLDHHELHPLMWAAKPHYYGSAFYNWPYTFGLLFGLGLYARWLEDADRFQARYADMLASTGVETADQLARRFDIDLARPAFWDASLDVLRARIDDFCAAAHAARPPG
ncbi:MAG TPA: M3 family oligoendopeptidase [Acidimicrobiales bacterium]|nr:M3 family oligoendopeptidase [Acidimicrobiales bacterium]